MKDWYKTLELEKHEVLFIKDYNEEDDLFEIVILLRHEGVTIESKLGYEEEEKRDYTWDNWPDDNGATWANNLLSMIP